MSSKLGLYGRSLWLLPSRSLLGPAMGSVGSQSFASKPRKPLSKLESWEQTISQLGERLTPELTEDKEKSNISKVLRQLLDSRLEQQSSDPSLNSHFQELFSGLETLTEVSDEQQKLSAMTDSGRLEYVLLPKHTEKDILKLFEDMYYHGLVSPRIATEVLRDKRVTDISHISRLINSGGTLIKWPLYEKYFFQLQIANKLWQLRNKDEARELITKQFQAVWITQLVDNLNKVSIDRVNMFLRAIFAAQTDLEWSLTDRLLASSDWQTLYMTWTMALKFSKWDLAYYIIDKSYKKQPLFGSLRPIVDAYQVDPKGLEPVTTFVPKNKNWDSLLFKSLVSVAYARDELSAELIDLLRVLQINEPAEARLAALKLSIHE